MPWRAFRGENVVEALRRAGTQVSPLFRYSHALCRGFIWWRLTIAVSVPSQSVIASEDSTVWTVPQSVFKTLILSAAQQNKQTY